MDTLDLLDWLRSKGYGPLVDALQDPACYMKNGKVAVMKLARVMGVHPYKAQRMLDEVRELLKDKA